MNVLRKLLEEEEGRVPWAYPDIHGYTTIGVGHLIDRRKGGRLPDRIIDLLLDYDMAEVVIQCQRIPGYLLLNEVQRAAIESMIFQMGFEPFDGDGFKDFSKMLGFLAKGDVKQAAAEGLRSQWAREDSPRRARRQMKMLETGLLQPFNIGE